jgi:hypothetical protein
MHDPPPLTRLTTSRRLDLNSTDIRLKTALEVISVQQSVGTVEDPVREDKIIRKLEQTDSPCDTSNSIPENEDWKHMTNLDHVTVNG